MHRAPLNAPDQMDPPMHICPLTPESGFSVLHEGDQWLIWIIVAGVIDLYACTSFDEVVETLVAKEPQLRGAWIRAGRKDDFAPVWERALRDLAEKFDSAEERESGVNERLKRQLLWAFDPCGVLDADRFLTILAHEGVHLTEKQLIALVAEMLPGVQGSLRRRAGGGDGGGAAGLN